MKPVFTIIKKEFARFFKDIRLVLSCLILPGLLIYAVYSLMGSILEKVEKDQAEEQLTACVINMPDSQSQTLSTMFTLSEDYGGEDGEERAKSAVKDGDLSLLVIFPENFDKSVQDYSPTSGTAAPNVQIYFSSAHTSSAIAYQSIAAALDGYESALANKFDVNKITQEGQTYDLADEQSTSRMMLSMVVPMVLLMLLFSGCMAVAPESIAGEKERGTIATILVTPVKRSSVAIGKIVALSVIALLSGLVSSIGTILSLPKLAGMTGGITLAMYTFGDYIALIAVILTTVLIFVSLISVISALAKSVKEASGLIVPLMLVVMMCGIFSMFAGGVSSIGLSFIPVFNSALAFSAILSGTLAPAALAITLCVNVAFAALAVFVLTLMFKSERIMFNK